MPNFNPFSDDHEDTSFEQGSPLNQTARNAAKAASSQTQAQVQASNKAIVDQLYGFIDPTNPTEDDQQANDAAKQHSQNSHGQQANQANTSSANTPEEQAKIEKIRRELFAKTHGGQFSIEQQMEKARKEREQKEQQLKQQEEEEERQKLEAQKAQQEEFAMPAGKKTGMVMGKKQQQPVALTQAKTKTEINRGASG